MGTISINSQTYQLCVIEQHGDGESTVREFTEEDFAKLSKSQQLVVASLQQQARLMQELAKMQAQAALEIEKIQCFCEAERELRHEIEQWVKQGWGYKPKLHRAASKPHRAKPYWHRTRSFCVRKGYH